MSTLFGLRKEQVKIYLEDTKNFWLSALLGKDMFCTGKTFASFIVKHILEDNLDEAKKYFTHHEIDSLWQRGAGVRGKGKILVVHQSSSPEEVINDLKTIEGQERLDLLEDIADVAEQQHAYFDERAAL